MLKEAGITLAKIIKQIQEFVKPGISTNELNHLAEDLIHKEGALPAFKGFNGFPATLCTSINEEVVHGIPSERKLNEGDILSLDLGLSLNGYFSDAAVTIAIGKVSHGAKRLIEVTRASLYEGIKQARPNNNLLDISYSIQNYVERYGFSVVRKFVGHGIGLSLHEEPEIPNFGRPHEGPQLKAGMVLAIEPMVNMGSWECEMLENGWTAVTKDRFPSAHFEHTVAITQEGPQILTKGWVKTF